MLSRSLLLGAIVGVTSLSASADDWPQFRGPNRDNRVTGFEVPATWPKELKKQWAVKVGNGVGAPVMVGDKIYTFTRVSDEEVVRCLDAKSGKELWFDKNPVEKVTGGASGYPGPRNSPGVGDGKVCTFGISGRLSCYDAGTGKLAWRKDTKGRPFFFTSTSPLIADGKCIIHTGSSSKGPGGKGELVAYDLATGDEKWKWTGDGPGYGSPIIATIKGVKQIVEITDENLVGVGFDDGKLLWKTRLTTGRYQSATPVVDGDLAICGGIAFTIEKSGDTFSAKQKWKERAPATYNSPVLKDGVLYGLADAGGGGKGVGKGMRSTTLFAQDAKTGAELWTEKSPRGECGTILDVGPVMILSSSDSNLVAFKPSKDEFKEIAKYKVADTPTWATPILAGKRIYVKDADSVILWTLE